MSEADLKKHVKAFIAEHETVEQAARIVGVSPTYMYALANGTRTNPSPHMLDAMGIHRMVIYQRIDS